MALRRSRPTRPGKVLALFALVLPAIISILGLVIDSGMALSHHRQLQNAIDSSSKAAALQLLRDRHLGSTTARTNATAEANSYFGTQHGYTRTTLTTNYGNSISRTRYGAGFRPGRDYGETRYVELVSTHTVSTWIAPFFGVGSTPLHASAVAGYEPVPWPEGIICLDPRANQGLTDPRAPFAGLHMANAGQQLSVNGSIVVNARGMGSDQYGDLVDWGYPLPSIDTTGNAKVNARYVQTRGGVRDIRDMDKYVATDPDPLFARAGIVPDPLGLAFAGDPNFAPVPNSSFASLPVHLPFDVNTGFHQPPPGIYPLIRISGNATVELTPGIYVLRPESGRPFANGDGLEITGRATVRMRPGTSAGVMFYLTTQNYDPDNPPEVADGPVNYNYSTETVPQRSDNARDFARVLIDCSRANVNLRGINSTNSPGLFARYPDLLFFQRRNYDDLPPIFIKPAEMFVIEKSGNGTLNLSGTIYAKWGIVTLRNNSRNSTMTLDTQIIAGRVNVEGTGDIHLNLTRTGAGARLNRETAVKTFLVQ